MEWCWGKSKNYSVRRRKSEERSKGSINGYVSERWSSYSFHLKNKCLKMTSKDKKQPPFDFFWNDSYFLFIDFKSHIVLPMTTRRYNIGESICFEYDFAFFQRRLLPSKDSFSIGISIFSYIFEMIFVSFVFILVERVQNESVF